MYKILVAIMIIALVGCGDSPSTHSFQPTEVDTLAPAFEYVDVSYHVVNDYSVIVRPLVANTGDENGTCRVTYLVIHDEPVIHFTDSEIPTEHAFILKGYTTALNGIQMRPGDTVVVKIFNGNELHDSEIINVPVFGDG